MSEKTGLLFIGMLGATASTTIAGSRLVSGGFCSDTGLVSNTPPLRHLQLRGHENFEFGGWDISQGTLHDAIKRHDVFPQHLMRLIELHVPPLVPFQGISGTYDIPLRPEDTHRVSSVPAREAYEKICSDIQ